MPEFKRKILVVEDEVQFARMIAIRLQSEGFDVNVSTDAYGGTQEAIRNTPDLIILDLMMPAGGGFSMLERINKIPKTSTIPVIILTGRNIVQNIKKTAAKYGIRKILKKPYDKDELLGAINSLISSQ